MPIRQVKWTWSRYWRILRQPHTRQYVRKGRNRSYVLTCSNDFSATLNAVVKGLNAAGFNARDCQVGTFVAAEELGTPIVGTQLTMNEPPAQVDIPDIDDTKVKELLEARQPSAQSPGQTTPATQMLAEATELGNAYDEAVEYTKNRLEDDLPMEERDKMNVIPVNQEFAEELRLPPFSSIFHRAFFEDGLVPLDKAALAGGFTLKSKPYEIDFTAADDEIAEVDVADAEGGTPKVLKMSGADQQHLNISGTSSSITSATLCRYWNRPWSRWGKLTRVTAPRRSLAAQPSGLGNG